MDILTSFHIQAHQISGCWFEHKLSNISQPWLHFNCYSYQCWMYHLIAALWMLAVYFDCSHTHKDTDILFKLIVCSCLSSLVHLFCARQISQLSLDHSPRLNHEMQLSSNLETAQTGPMEWLNSTQILLSSHRLWRNGTEDSCRR